VHEVSAVVINLARRPDRLAAFGRRFTAAMPGMPVRVVTAVDTGTGAGCLASHLHVLATSVGPTLVMEDDCTFAPEFTADLDALDPPPDWDVLWLGGQHKYHPLPVDERWCRPQWLLRTHCYLAREPGRIAELMHERRPDRMDPAMGMLPVRHYALRRFTAGQTAGLSDLDGQIRRDDQFWRT
jgi:hypothetical protein